MGHDWQWIDEQSGVSLGRARCHYMTSRAIKVLLEDEGRAFWVPQSVVHDDSEVWKTGDSGDLCVYQWWAEKNGFI
jgi:hypothetical protein